MLLLLAIVTSKLCRVFVGRLCWWTMGEDCDDVYLQRGVFSGQVNQKQGVYGSKCSNVRSFLTHNGRFVKRAPINPPLKFSGSHDRPWTHNNHRKQSTNRDRQRTPLINETDLDYLHNTLLVFHTLLNHGRHQQTISRRHGGSSGSQKATTRRLQHGRILLENITQMTSMTQMTQSFWKISHK